MAGKLGFACGLLLLAAQLGGIAYSRFTPLRYFCWAPFDQQTQYTLAVELGGESLSPGQIQGRYRRPATGSDNRIEGNSCTSGSRGIEVVSSGNVIIKNTCANNTLNWSIAANNVYGPIIDRSAPASAAVNGNSAPSSLGSSEANANFTF